jgi:hypothetical protein
VGHDKLATCEGLHQRHLDCRRQHTAYVSIRHTRSLCCTSSTLTAHVSTREHT